MLCITSLHLWFEKCKDECNLILELIVYKFELSHNTTEAAVQKVKIIVEILLRLQEPQRSGKPKIVDSKAKPPALETNLTVSTKSISELGI